MQKNANNEGAIRPFYTARERIDKYSHEPAAIRRTGSQTRLNQRRPPCF
jgi:hypothetical protein